MLKTLKFDSKINLYDFLIISMLSILSGVLYNTLSNRGISFIYTPITVESGRIIELKDAYEFHKQGQAVFLDARDSDAYTKNHIRGAVSLPITASRTEKAQILTNIPKEQLIVTYCDGSDCSSSIELAEQLTQIGYQNVVIFFDGWDAWIESGQPIE